MTPVALLVKRFFAGKTDPVPLPRKAVQEMNLCLTALIWRPAWRYVPKRISD